MNTSSHPSHSSDAKPVEVDHFEIGQRFTSEELAGVSGLWRRKVELPFKTSACGEGVLRLSMSPPSRDGAFYLMVRAGKQLMQLVFSNADWLSEIQLALQDGQRLADHPSIAAIAIEAQLTPIFVDLERGFRSGLEISSVSLERQDPFANGAAGLAFELSLDKSKDCRLSVFAETDEMREEIINALKGISRWTPAAPNRAGAVELKADLVGDAIKMTRDKLRRIKPGDGFMLNADWKEKTNFRLMIQGHLVAELTGSTRGFEVKKVLAVGSFHDQQSKETTRSERRQKRLKERKSG